MIVVHVARGRNGTASVVQCEVLGIWAYEEETQFIVKFQNKEVRTCDSLREAKIVAESLANDKFSKVKGP